MNSSRREDCCTAALATGSICFLAGATVAYMALAFSAIGSGQDYPTTTILALAAASHAVLTGAVIRLRCDSAVRPIWPAVVFVPAVSAVVAAVIVNRECGAADACASALVYDCRQALIAAGVTWVVALIIGAGYAIQGLGRVVPGYVPLYVGRAPAGYDATADGLSLDSLLIEA